MRAARAKREFRERPSDMRPRVPGVGRVLPDPAVRLAAINAIEGWDQSPVPTPEQLQAHFDTYKKTVASQIPGPPDAPYLLNVEVDPDAMPKDNPEHPYRAVLGFPDAANKATKVHVGDKLPWDGSTVVDVTSRGMILSGAGRTQVYRRKM